MALREKIKKKYFESRQQIEEIWQEFEEDNNLSSDEIIEARRSLFTFLIEVFNGMKKGGDCIPKYIKIGSFDNAHITIEYHEE
jgi:hypothetical protein